MNASSSQKIDWKALRGPIGLFGGTFDPIQNAHCAVAKAAIESGRVQSVVFIPAGLNPLKSDLPGASGTQRMEMIRLGVGSAPGYYVSDIELLPSPAAPSYTADTVQEIKQKTSPSQKLFFLMGSDCISHFGKWHRVNHLIDMLDGFLVYPRPGYPIETAVLTAQGFSPEQAAKILKHTMHGDRYEVAAQEIRKRIASKQSISDLVPAAVAEYIRSHKLYLPQPAL